MTDILLRRVSESWPGADGEDDYDVIGTHGVVIGRIFKSTTSPAGTPWMWTLSCGESETHGYKPTREAAMQAFARSWHREG